MTFARTLAPALVATCAALAVPLPATSDTGAPSPVAVVQRYVAEVLDEARHELLEQLVAPEKVDAFRKNLELRRALFPDLHYRVEEIVAEGHRVVVRCTLTGHHVGDDPERLPGHEVIPPSGRWLESEEVLFYTVEGGRITAAEIVTDQLQVVKALGFTVVPPEGYEKGAQD